MSFLSFGCDDKWIVLSILEKWKSVVCFVVLFGIKFGKDVDWSENLWLFNCEGWGIFRICKKGVVWFSGEDDFCCFLFEYCCI